MATNKRIIEDKDNVLNIKTFLNQVKKIPFNELKELREETSFLTDELLKIENRSIKYMNENDRLLDKLDRMQDKYNNLQKAYRSLKGKVKRKR